MSIEIARTTDLPVLRRLLHMGRFVFSNIADEDLPAAVAKGMTLLAGGRGHAWGALVVDPERPRPASLPPDSPDRAQLRALALRHGPWVEGAAAALLEALAVQRRAVGRPLLISVYPTEAWLRTQLLDAGFAHADTVVFYRLASLEGVQQAEDAAGADRIRIRPAALGEIEQIAELDAATFEPLWHFGAPDLVEMCVRGRVQVALLDGRLAGYAALLTGYRQEAHLARLAVHPEAQGAGLGRRLLLDALGYARAEGYVAVALNTQESNTRSQALYRSVGFVPSGTALPVFTRILPPCAPST